jgi:hypothetical protein
MQSRSAFEHASLQNTLVAVWVGDPTTEGMLLFFAELEKLCARYPSGIYVLNVIGERTGIPDASVRQLLSRQFEAMRGRVLCLAVAMEKAGIAGTMSRAVLSTLLTMTRRPFQMSVHLQRIDAAKWLAQQPGAPPAAQLLEMTTTLERRGAA